MEPVDFAEKSRILGGKLWSISYQGDNYGLRIEEFEYEGKDGLAMSASKQMEDGSYQTIEDSTPAFLLGLVGFVLYFNIAPVAAVGKDVLAVLRAEDLPQQ